MTKLLARDWRTQTLATETVTMRMRIAKNRKLSMNYKEEMRETYNN